MAVTKVGVQVPDRGCSEEWSAVSLNPLVFGNVNGFRHEFREPSSGRRMASRAVITRRDTCLVDVSRASWVNTTHDWSGVVDADHLAHIRQSPTEFAPDGPWHLNLEVLAYAADEASSKGGGRCVVVLHPDGSLSVRDDGRGTDTAWTSTAGA